LGQNAGTGKFLPYLQRLMSDKTAVDLHQVSYTYPNGLQALTPINLRVERGEFVSLLGPSGCGKSTILRLVAGLLAAPGDGEIQVQADGLACVFQSPTLMPWASVELTLTGNPGGDRRVEHALQLVGLEDFRAAYPRELSGGMQMRVSIARALVTQPSLLLMDEPFAALDEITRNKLDTDLLALHAAQNLTVLFVTHSIYEAVFLSTRIAVMSARPGRVVGELAIDEPSDATGPRGDAFRGSEKFARCCAEASRLLHLGMSESVAA
jgi:NitT/TauT family transport system ATP-binding protein